MDTYLATMLSPIWSWERFRARKEAFRSNGSINSMFRSRMSLFPISTIVPPLATIRHDSCKISPDKELRTASTPFPFVCSKIPEANAVVREENMWSSGISQLSRKKSRFSWVPTVANICESR